MSKLLACPFCGEYPYDVEVFEYDLPSHHFKADISCKVCDYISIQGVGNTEEEAKSRAIEQWNTRNSPVCIRREVKDDPALVSYYRCSHCGEEIYLMDKYCSYCGSRIIKDE